MQLKPTQKCEWQTMSNKMNRDVKRKPTVDGRTKQIGTTKDAIETNISRERVLYFCDNRAKDTIDAALLEIVGQKNNKLNKTRTHTTITHTQPGNYGDYSKVLLSYLS